MPPAGFETTIRAGERSQSYALDSAATGISHMKHEHQIFLGYNKNKVP